MSPRNRRPGPACPEVGTAAREFVRRHYGRLGRPVQVIVTLDAALTFISVVVELTQLPPTDMGGRR